MNRYPKIRFSDLEKSEFEEAWIEKIMRHLLPPNFFTQDEVATKFHGLLPLICWSPIKEPPFHLSFYLCSAFTRDGFRFFYDFITSWLIPGKKINGPLQFAADFFLPEISSQKYIAGQVVILIENRVEADLLQKNLSIIENELKMGVKSHFHAMRILENKGLSTDKKSALIQENLMTLIKRRPQNFDHDLLTEMHQFLVLCKDEFKRAKSYLLLSRIIAIHYLFKKSLLLSSELFSEKRFINAKLIRYSAFNKHIIGIILAISFLKENERLEAKHIADAANKIIPNISRVSGSWFFKQGGSNNKICTFYLEVEKNNHSAFTKREFELLKQSISKEIQAHIERRVNPLFMPQNEESVLRDILTLSQQLRLIKDMPQAIISYHHQSEESLEFSVIILRVLKPNMPSIASYFDQKKSTLEFFLDCIKSVGTLRRKYIKEATLFRLQIAKAPFLRQDHSVDLTNARSSVVSELRQIIGAFRDYNGGSISKEAELFEKLCFLLGDKAEEFAFLLENFFYSLTPAIMRATLPVESLKRAFLMVLKAKEEGLFEEQELYLKLEEHRQYSLMLVVGVDNIFVRAVIKLLPSLHIPHRQLAYTFINTEGVHALALIYRDPDEQLWIKLKFLIEKLITEKSQKIHHLFS